MRMAVDGRGRRWTAVDSGGQRRKEAVWQWRAVVVAIIGCGQVESLKRVVDWGLTFFLPGNCPPLIFFARELPVAPAKTNHYQKKSGQICPRANKIDSLFTGEISFRYSKYLSPQMSVHSKISPNNSDRTYVRRMYWILLSRKMAGNKNPWAPTSLTGDANGLHHG
jgi:hypothetical protein